MKNKYIFSFVAATLALSGCTKLDENLNGQVGSGSLGANDVPGLITASYTAMRGPYQAPWNWSALQEVTSDEAIVPTRAGDWDDNGAWRALHLHKWASDDARISDVFRDLNSISYVSTNVLGFNPTPAQAATARFLRAFSQFSILDGWGQVPYREPGEGVTKPSKVRNASEQITYLISELTAIIPTLPDGPAHQANKNAARTLLMKIYLNKGAFLNRTAPTFDPADMARVISLADEIATGGYTLTTNYFDNFASTNDVLSRENIFTSQNLGGVAGSDLDGQWKCTLHYNQNPNGYNGFATLSDFYNKFEATDKRRGGAYTGQTNVSGIRVGFLVGPQFDQTGAALKDRKGNALAFTPEVSIIERDPNHLEVAGIRVIKYPIDYPNSGTRRPDNDWVYYRYADVLLMKAEALLRTSQAGAALTIVNSIRTARGASAFASLNLDNLLDERGRELYWESFRRQDLIRFGKFLAAWQEKPASESKYMLFPIPDNQLGNPNLVQNPGF
ncbi:RagB/SusD family nutrient uptake outer membrane protein [Pedobacter sp. CFBP9032]|uniref:RagB/SusD family nutrient uptake outer membrane protein n=1 Tax=Pedobacter sp. CFBP9032 TaxID=3096539 RepID=UPI002A6B52B6|nr:RagB/SusD family nutrient uptake outer membrane protein [Pedobacter sp. CFBP9032]MDY0904545.1 RagB/SusD family nutrient uptake outer membrane protein [Pedobacter sp. CFBP9032]